MADTGLGPDGNYISTNGRFDLISGSSGAIPVAAGGTMTFQYLPQRARVCYMCEDPSLLTVRALQGIYTQDQPGAYTISYNPTNIVVTWLGASTIPANANVSLQLPLRDTSGAPVGPDEYTLSPDIQPPGL